ncbi:unnamed protein product [Strongylus vulgaris]|uniref:Uncharacterized protein n=1 Tax=Strongylus vulgaris TaxID=40348 RepID=A0A3P7JSM0_STRVU|nr:unnamed protein product [Strongylus vulgaris]
MTSHPTTWTPPDLNAFPVLAVFRIPMSKKSGWAVGHAIRGAYMANFMDGQITQIEMGEQHFQVTAQLQTSSAIRFRTYLINARWRRISVATLFHTLEERANPVLKMLEV